MHRKDNQPDKKTLDYYNSHAARVFQLYSSIPSPLKDLFLEFLPPGGRILDIGCAAGRELNALRQEGFEAYGMESSRELIDQLQENCPALKDYVFPGYLPEGIPEDIQGRSPWDGLVCSAVLQHIRDSQLAPSAASLSRLLIPRGRLILTVPGSYPLKKDDRDEQERLFRIRPAEELMTLFENCRLGLLERRDSRDSLKRDGISWMTLIFEKEG